MRQIIFFTFLTFTFSCFSNKTASEIYVDLQKLHSLKRVLYIAAHPDDENTRALAYFSLGEKAETAYLSLTRGDGGQNLIGKELGEFLGVLRTQELLAARSYDGAKQFFTRAVDFGYSRSAEESFEKWGKDEILSDVVLVIRKFRPDAIITRFPADSRAGHGHHTASALLAIEAFEKAADPNYLPWQVEQYGIWKTKSIYWNTSVWWGKNLDSIAKVDEKYFVQDIGGYNNELGMSYNEIGTIARSQHKCQGFGAVIERGSRLEYYEHLGGEFIHDSFFEQNDQSWGDLVNPDFEDYFNTFIDNFNFKYVEQNVKALLYIQSEIQSLPASSFRDEKLNLCNAIIINCLGLHIEAVTNDYAYTSGDSIELSFNLINRSSQDVRFKSYSNGKGEILVNKPLAKNEIFEEKVKLDFNRSISGPYWLKKPFINLFDVPNNNDLGKAQEDPTLSYPISLVINGSPLKVNVPVTYKWRDPSYGERRRNLISTPALTANFDQKSAILQNGKEKNIRIKIHGYKQNLKETIHFKAPKGWVVSPEKLDVELINKHDELSLEFKLSPNENAERGELYLTNDLGEKIYSHTEIVYNHIPTQSIFRPASISCVELDVKINPGKVAYIKGVEDVVPAAIQQLGFDVEVFEVSDLATLDLSTYQTVVLGIRIYNVHPELENHHRKLFAYVNEGGNVIMQYNTASRSIRDKKFGPIPFELSRNRVTEEDAEVNFLASDHPLMNQPNKITKADFEDWVQERGLYFANNWDDAYTPLFSWHDKDQEDVEGALIVAKYGKGQFIYTGISFFRELPQGVVGAYRLFANLLSYQAE